MLRVVLCSLKVHGDALNSGARVQFSLRWDEAERVHTQAVQPNDLGVVPGLDEELHCLEVRPRRLAHGRRERVDLNFALPRRM